MNNKVRLIRNAKYYLYKWKIHRLIPASFLNFVGHTADLSKWIDDHRELEYSTFPIKKFDIKERYKLHRYIIDHKLNDEPIDYLEFGVSKGVSFRWWMENIMNKDSSFYGFDTFTGLPEDWGHFRKGDMSNGNAPPEIDDTRHQFYQGIFQSTLHDFLSGYQVGKRKVIHMDADLFSSTLFVLVTISPYLRKGDIIMFDEFNVPMHEYKAFKDWTESFYIDYKVIGEVNNYYQVAIIIE